MTQKKSESREKPEVKEKSTSKDKPESKEKSTGKEKPVNKEKAPSKEKSEGKKKTANKAKLTSKIKLDKPELNKFTVGGIVVLMIVVLGGFYSCSDTEPGKTPLPTEQLAEAQEPPKEEPKTSFEYTGIDGNPVEVTVEEKDLSQSKIEPVTPLEKIAEQQKYPEIDDVVKANSNAMIEDDGILTSYNTISHHSRYVFMDKNFFMNYRDDRTKANPTGCRFYLDPAFIIMEDDLKSMEEVASQFKNGPFSLSVFVRTTHKVFLESALDAVKAKLKSDNVPNFEEVGLKNLDVIPVVGCDFNFPGHGWEHAQGVGADGNIRFNITFKNQEDFNNFKKALLGGVCQIKYDVYGQIAKTSSLHTCVQLANKSFDKITVDNDVQDEGFKAGVKDLHVRTSFKSGGANVGLGSLPGMIFFDIETPSYSKDSNTWQVEQTASHKVTIDKEALRAYLSNIFEKITYSLDILDGTPPEKTQMLLDLAKAAMAQGDFDTKCERVSGVIESYNKEADEFVLKLEGNGLLSDLSPSEITSLKDAISGAFTEKVNSSRKNDGNVNVAGKLSAGVNGENKQSKDSSGNEAYDALVTGTIKFPIGFTFYRIGDFLLKFEKTGNFNISEWSAGVYPAKNGFVAVCEEIPERTEVFKCTLESQKATILPRDWEREGSGCLAQGFSILVDASLSKIENSSKDVNSFGVMFDMDVKIDGNDNDGNNTLYQQSRTSKKTVKRGDATTVDGESISEGNSERGAVFKFLGFCDEKGKRALGNKIEISFEQNEPKCNHGTSGPDKPDSHYHNSPPINLLQQHPDARNLFKKLTVTGEYHNYYQKYEEYDFIDKLFSGFTSGGEWDRHDECLTEQKVKFDCQQVFYYKAQIQLPTVVMKSNQGIGITIAKPEEASNQSQTQ